ncbi:MAG: ABC transporter substrate-binding protein [Casimicrobiaceae bacterium]
MQGTRSITRVLVGAALCAFVLVSNHAVAEPVKISIGYQPWWSGGVSAVVIRGLGPALWSKFLPADVEVDFQASPQGPVIINNMLAGKQQIGYMGDMPGVVATTKPQMADIRMVAVTSFSAGQMCHLLLVRRDAPAFKSPKEAVQWIDGKVAAAPKGGCTDLFFRSVIKEGKIEPKEYGHQSVEQIVTNFRVGKLDAAVVPDIPRAKIEAEGTARLVATGFNFGLPDAGVLVMRKDFMDQYPQIAKAWLRMEMFVQTNYLIDPKQWDEVAKLTVAQNPGYTTEQVKASLFSRIPAEKGGAPVRQTFPFVFDDQVKAKMVGAYKFLNDIKIIDVDKPREGAIDDNLARQVAAEDKVKLPLGDIR